MDREIARADWPTFADQFSETNQGRSVSVELVGETLGAAEMIEAVQLVEVDYDDKGEEAFLITVGRGGEEMTHMIPMPTTLWRHSRADGRDLALEIVADDGGKTILKFEEER